MQFSLLVLGSPYSTQSSTSALRFAMAALNAGHTLHRVFFYHDGVTNGNSLITPPQDETNIPEQWQAIADNHRTELILCISSALKRGVLDKTEANRYSKLADNVHPQFEISGLGQLVDAAVASDRLITFGP